MKILKNLICFFFGHNKVWSENYLFTYKCRRCGKVVTVFQTFNRLHPPFQKFTPEPDHEIVKISHKRKSITLKPKGAPHVK